MKLLKKIGAILLVAVILASMLPMEVVFATVADFTTWVYWNLNANATYSVTSSNATWTITNNGQSYVEKDLGVGYFSGDFLVKFNMKINNFSSGGLSILYPMTVGHNNWNGGEGDSLKVTSAAVSTYNVFAEQNDGGVSHKNATGFQLNCGTEYYIEMHRDETIGTFGQFSVTAWTNSSKTTQVGSDNYTLVNAKRDLQYLWSEVKSNIGNTNTGYISNLEYFTHTLASLAVTPLGPVVPLGNTQQMQAIGTYDDSTTSNWTALVTWHSSNTGVATINATTGLVTTVAIGTTGIWATSGAVTSNNITFQVTSAALASIAITPTTSNTTVLLTQQFEAVGTYTDSSTANVTGSVTWSSSNTGITTIGAGTGIMTGVAVGSANISATSGSIHSNNATATIIAATLTSMSVTPANPRIIIGSTQQFMATGTYNNGTTANITNSVTWTSSNTSVATVNATGAALGIASRLTTISATSGSISANTTLRVPVGVPVNTDLWYFYQNDSALYAGATSLTVNGTGAGSWHWQYASAFTDLTGNGNTANPSFRTAATAAGSGVSVALTQFGGTTVSNASPINSTSTSDVLPGTAITISQLYTEGNFSHVPLADSINAILQESQVPWELWWYPTIFGIILILGFTVYWGTTVSARGGIVSVESTQDGSLLLMCAVMEILLAVAGVVNVIPFWPTILFLIPTLAVIVSRKQYSW